MVSNSRCSLKESFFLVVVAVEDLILLLLVGKI
jgi:hypothetical protein